MNALRYALVVTGAILGPFVFTVGARVLWSSWPDDATRQQAVLGVVMSVVGLAAAVAAAGALLALLSPRSSGLLVDHYSPARGQPDPPQRATQEKP